MAPTRCTWVDPNHELYCRYHDLEWGVPVKDDLTLFEFLILEGAQAGLSWVTVLNKRENYREAFEGFVPEKVARYDSLKEAELLRNPGIIRNRLKIRASVKNARAFLAVQEQHGSFSNYLWDFVGGKPIQNSWNTIKEVPAKTELSDRISKDLKKKGFGFVGSTIIYAYLQAVGLVNDHTTDCFRYREVKTIG
ncbi:MAG: DNA-3-methyladenine glycosylase I [Calditrichaeota bacterium]|nr:DNA-3-methyladenine glycosylase I [Calditrichota bacterium]HQU70866.1 DNA-3-methyladenine glycosylase I [Calditrichia bacterium]